MVKLDRIYTGGGDGGETSLGDGERVAKHSPRMEACGSVDEANAALGLARLHVSGAADAMLARIQNDLFDPRRRFVRAGGRTEGRRRAAGFAKPDRAPGSRDRRHERGARTVEVVCPAGRKRGGGASAPGAHGRPAGRTQRRALAAVEDISAPALVYLNRLSDHLFVLARRCNDDGRADVLWRPGATR